ncbi:Prenylcysteine lyase [Dichotomocladium elegans]|nr:Prenylcysteine lyase [Dichotomocladium elegans]
MVIPIKDDPSVGFIELGASIFVEKNYNLMNATKRFGLGLTRLTELPIERGLGIWDGKEFLFEETGNHYWDILKLIWRYGYTPIKFDSFLQATISQFLNGAYHDKDDVPPFLSVEESLVQYGLEELTNITSSGLFEKKLKLSNQFVREVIQTSTRANYGQDVDILHGFGGLVSMSTAGASATEGGNFQIFEQFALRSGADLKLETAVVSLRNTTEVDDNGNIVKSYIVTTDDGQEEVFDAVLFAAPIHLSNIEMDFPNAVSAEREYQIVHVTMIAGVVDPSYFGRKWENMPTLIVTTGVPLTGNFKESTQPFTTFGIHRFLKDTGESIVKMFSPEPLSDDILDQLFHNRSWTHRKAWEAFPKLYSVGANEEWPPVILHGWEDDSENGVIYVNAFESCISTMETETVASKNAVRILRDRWCTDMPCVPFTDGWGDN